MSGLQSLCHSSVRHGKRVGCILLVSMWTHVIDVITSHQLGMGAGRNQGTLSMKCTNERECKVSLAGRGKYCWKGSSWEDYSHFHSCLIFLYPSWIAITLLLFWTLYRQAPLPSHFASEASARYITASRHMLHTKPLRKFYSQGLTSSLEACVSFPGSLLNGSIPLWCSAITGT